jgi:uncharacterized membrane protein YdbT with pleckstrin-like domain
MSKVWHLPGNLKTRTWLAMVTTIAVIERILFDFLPFLAALVLLIFWRARQRVRVATGCEWY